MIIAWYTFCVDILWFSNNEVQSINFLISTEREALFNSTSSDVNRTSFFLGFLISVRGDALSSADVIVVTGWW